MNKNMTTLRGQEFFILVHRYEKPEDAWGLHKFTPGAVLGQMSARPFATNLLARRFPHSVPDMTGDNPLYLHEIIGLFSTAKKDELVRDLIESPVPPELEYYVYTQVTPIEWEARLKDVDSRLRAMVTVLVHP